MEGINYSQNFFTHPYGYSFYNPSLYYYQYCNQTALQNLNYSYNQYSSHFYPTNQNYVSHAACLDPLEPNTPTSSNDHPISEQNSLHRQTRSKAYKNTDLIKRIEKANLTPQGKQKENRNVYSNILRSFFRRISQDQKIQKLVLHIIQKRQLSITSEEFFDYLKRLKINYGKYLRYKKLRNVFINKQLKDHAIIFRVLFQHFKNSDFLTQTLTSRKIGKWSIILHLKGGRELKDRLLN